MIGPGAVVGTVDWSATAVIRSASAIPSATAVSRAARSSASARAGSPGSATPSQQHGEVVLGMGRPWSSAQRLVQLDRGGQVSLRVIESAEGRRKQTEIAIDGRHAPLGMADRVPPRIRLELSIEGRGRSDVIQQRACLGGDADPEQPLAVAVEHPELVSRHLFEDVACLRVTPDVDQETGQCRPVERVPRKLVDRRSHGRQLLADPTLLATEQEPLHPAGGFVVARRRHQAPGEHLRDELLREREVAVEQRQQ